MPKVNKDQTEWKRKIEKVQDLHRMIVEVVKMLVGHIKHWILLIVKHNERHKLMIRE